MELNKNQTRFGDYIIQVDKEPVIYYTGSTDWIRTVKILNSSGECIMSFTINDVDSQVISTGLYMYYSDECFNPEFNFDPNYGADVILDFDLLEVLNPIVCSKYDVQIMIESYCAWGIVNVDIPSTSINLDRFVIQMNGHNGSLNIRIYHIDRYNTTIQMIDLNNNNVEEVYSLCQLVNDELDSLVNNFIQNNL